MKFGYFLITDLKKDHDNILLVDKFCDKFISDSECYNGKYPNRVELLDKIGPNDTLFVYELSHIVETISGFFKLKDLLVTKSIPLISIRERIDTSCGNLDQEYILQLFTELDSQTRSRKTMAGLKNAKKDGMVGGRPKGILLKNRKKAQEVVKLGRDEVETKEIIKITGVPRTSVYRYLEQFGVRETKKRVK